MHQKLLLLLVTQFFFFQGFNQNQIFDFQNGFTKNTNLEMTPHIEVLQQSEKTIILNYRFARASFSEKQVHQSTYHFLNIEGLSQIGQVGAPALPVKNEILALPKNATMKIEVLQAEFKTFTNFNIHPALKPARDTEGAPEPKFEKNNAIYTSNEFYPNRIASSKILGKIRQTGLGKLQVSPLQYNPVTKEIKAYSQITVKVTFEGGSPNFDYLAQNNSRHFSNMLKRGVLNSTSIPNGAATYGKNKITEAKEYIIITHTAYAEQASQLAQWKRQLGYSVEVIEDTEWTSEKVKQKVEMLYNSWNPKPDYLLIIGDHTGQNAVPGQMLPVFDTGEEFASDLYYVCMDGSSDFIPDMARGRIPVSTVTEAQTIVDKIINYEQSPVNDTDFFSNVLNCAQYQDDDNNGYADRRFTHTSENIRDYLMLEQNYNSQRIYYSSTSANISSLHYNNGYYSNGQLLPAELRDNAFDWNGGSNDITNAINDGKFLVVHRDHGYEGGSGWAHPYYTTSTMTNLSNNDLLPIVFSMNCHTGEYQLSNSFAEKILRMPNKGAVGVVGAAYYSYSGYNDALTIGMIDAIWSDPGIYPNFGYGGTGYNYSIGPGNDIYTLGDIVNQGLYAMLQNWNGNTSSEKYQYELFHYFGDPAMRIWTSNPNDSIIAATHNADIACDATNFPITESTPGALATLVANNKLLGETTIDSNGEGVINFNLSQPADEIILTISKVNNKPYTTQITITGNCDFAPTVTTDSVTNVLDISANLHGNILSTNGQPIISNGFVISTNPNPIIDEPNVIQIESVPVMDSGSYTIYTDALSTSSTYYMKAYAENSIGITYGSQIEFNTECAAINTFPYTQGFETGDLPVCWNYDGTEWAYQAGGHNQNPEAPHNGNYNALFYHDSYQEDISKLILPRINFTGYNSASLSFWHAQKGIGNIQDELRVYYRTSQSDNWSLLEAYTENISEWTEEIIYLPELSENYYLAFEATGAYGYGVVLDDIEINASMESLYHASFDVDNTEGQPIEAAKIEINGDSLMTDANGQASIQLYNGEYDFVITKTEFITYSSNFTIADTDLIIPVILNPYTYTATFNVNINGSPAENAGIEIADTLIHTQNNGIAYIELVNGSYEYNVNYEDLDPISGSILINNADTTENISFVGNPERSTENIKIYPNPAKDMAFIKTNTAFEVKLIDALGSILIHKKSAGASVLNLSDVSEGIYIIHIETPHQTLRKKLIIKQ